MSDQPDQTTKRRRAGDLAPSPTMWAALEGGAKLREILEDFYTRVYADPRLSPFFEGVTKERAIQKQYSFLSDKFTGTKLYFGDRPRNAHHWMVISDELFDYREALMESCLRRAALPEQCVADWRRLEEVFRKQIVKSAPIGRKIRGHELPVDGYETVELSVGALCDGCERVMEVGEVMAYHVRHGRSFCATCLPNPTPPRFAEQAG